MLMKPKPLVIMPINTSTNCVEKKKFLFLHPTSHNMSYQHFIARTSYS